MRKLILGSCLLLICGCGSEPGQQSASDEQRNSGSSPSAAETSSNQPATKEESQTLAIAQVADQAVRECLQHAHLSIQQGQMRDAVNFLSQAIGQDPDCSEAFALRARLHSDMGMDASAVADYSTAIRLDPKNARHYNARGFFLMSRKHAKSALQDLNAATKLDENFSEPYNNRGLLLLATGEVDNAITELTKALQRNPDYIDALNNRGIAYLQQDEKELALADLDKAVQLDPELSKSYNNRGLVHYRSANFEKALSDFTNAIMWESHNPKYYEHRRQTYIKMQRFNEAQADAAHLKGLMELGLLNSKIYRNPRDANLYVERGVYFAESGEDDKALQNFNRAIELDSKQAFAYSHRAGIWYRHEQFDRAIADCSEALRIEPHYEAYSVRGDSYMKVGDHENAIADFTNAKRFDESVAEAYWQHGQTLLQAGHTEEANQAIQHAVAMDPSLDRDADRGKRAPVTNTAATAEPMPAETEKQAATPSDEEANAKPAVPTTAVPDETSSAEEKPDSEPKSTSPADE